MEIKRRFGETKKFTCIDAFRKKLWYFLAAYMQISIPFMFSRGPPAHHITIYAPNTPHITPQAHPACHVARKPLLSRFVSKPLIKCELSDGFSHFKRLVTNPHLSQASRPTVHLPRYIRWYNITWLRYAFRILPLNLQDRSPRRQEPFWDKLLSKNGA